MPDIITIIYLVVGLGGGFLISEVMLRRNKALYIIYTALKKKNFIAFLETDKSVYCRIIKKMYGNLGITEQKEIIIIPKSSPKPCVNLGGAMIVHGDLYKSVCTPKEVREFVEKRLNDGWTNEDVAKFLEEIETIPPEQLKKHFFDLKNKPPINKIPVSPNNPIVNSETIPEQLKDDKEELINKQKYDVYINLSSVVKDYIYTGINRTTIHALLRELVYQRELEKMGGRNWLGIAIAIMIILIAVGVFIRFIFTSPAVVSMISGAMGGASRIAP
jgi:hypothetical protein